MCIDVQNSDSFTNTLNIKLFVKLEIQSKNLHSIGIACETVKPVINFFHTRYLTCF
jgi:hypothetical protein